MNDWIENVAKEIANIGDISYGFADDAARIIRSHAPPSPTWCEFTPAEMDALRSLSKRMELTHAQVLRQALRTYQLIATGRQPAILFNRGKEGK